MTATRNAAPIKAARRVGIREKPSVAEGEPKAGGSPNAKIGAGGVESLVSCDGGGPTIPDARGSCEVFAGNAAGLRSLRRVVGCLSRKGQALHFGDTRREAVALLGYGIDIQVFAALLAQRLTERGNRDCQVGFLHEAALPHRIENLVLGNQASPVFHQEDQQVKGPGS